MIKKGQLSAKRYTALNKNSLGGFNQLKLKCCKSFIFMDYTNINIRLFSLVHMCELKPGINKNLNKNKLLGIII